MFGSKLLRRGCLAKEKVTMGTTILLVLCVNILVFFHAQVLAQGQVRIMPMGNSLTLGTGGTPTPPHGYRKQLYTLLTNDGVNFDFVGQFDDDDGTFDGDHQGQAGLLAEDLANSVRAILSDKSAQIILLHIGTNDVAKYENSTTVKGNIEKVVDSIFAFDPSIKIILSSLVPRNDTPTRQTVTTELASKIRDLVDEKKADGVLIWFVDMYNAFVANPNWATDYLSADKFHPNDGGYALMANTFFPVLQTVLGSKDPGVVDDFNRPGPSPGENWDANAVYQIVNNQFSNTSSNYAWGHMAVWTPNSNPVAVSIRWGQGADAAGINEGGLVLRLDSPTQSASGYLVWLATTAGIGKRVQLWTVVNGQPGHSVHSISYSGAEPKAGDVFKVILRSDNAGHHFDCYLNNVFYGTVSDPNKLQGNTSPHYAGIMVRGKLNNDVDDFDFDKNPDFTPPAAITDLAVQSVSGTIVQLQWTAPGGDGNSGSATQYDVRYSTVPIDDNNFAVATQASGAPTPSLAGTTESMSVTGLTGGVTYYFAIKSKDEAGNISPLSNVVSATTTSSIVVSDDFERTTLGPNWTADAAFQIINGELHNTSTVQSWNFLALYNAKKNPISVQFQWGTTADDAGINEGGLALMMDAASTTANGYLLFRQATSGQIRLWTIENGAPGHSITSIAGKAGKPKAGSIVRVDLRSDASGHHFDVYINGVFDGTVTDPNKEQGNGNSLFAGFMLHGSLNNPVDNFQLTLKRGTASQIAKISGDLQEGSFGDTLVQPLVVQVLDNDGNPVPGEAVKFQVTQGAGTFSSGTGAFNLRVNVGGSTAYVDGAGNTWVADQAYAPGSFGYVGGQVDVIPSSQPIANTDDDELYHTERYGLTSYKADVPDGRYTIKLHFSESFMKSTGKRIFSVNIEGVPVLSNFDIFAETGGRYIALVKTIPFTVTDGVLDIDFTQFVDFSLLNALEILSSDDIGVSDDDGFVSKNFILGNVAGSNEITVSPESFTGNSVTFNVTNLGGPATQIAQISGDAQAAAAGQTLAQPFVVEVRDIANNPKAKQPVTFVVTRGGGTLDKQSPVLTDATGRASVTLTLGKMSEIQEVEAQTPGLAGSPIVFRATATSGVGKALQYVSGDNQSGTVGTNLPNPIVFRVVDVSNNPVTGFPAGLAVNRGGGSTTRNAPVMNPDFEGGFDQTSLGPVAKSWTGASGATGQIFSQAAGEVSGKNAQRIDTRNTPGSEAELIQALTNEFPDGITVRISFKYKADGTTADIVTILLRQKTNRNNILATWNVPGTAGRWHALYRDITWDTRYSPVELMVRVTGNQLVDVDALSLTPLTDSSGQISATWTLGDTVMTQEIEGLAFNEGERLTASARKVTATAITGPAKTIIAVSGNGQVGAANQPLANPFVVQVVDAFGNPKPNHPVTYTVTAGGGTLDGGVGSLTVNTGADGTAATTLTLGPTVGATNSVDVTASEGGNPLINSPLKFTAIAAVPSKLVRISGENQTGSATQPLDAPFKVLVLDNQDRPISGYPVTFEVTAGGGTINGQSTAMISTASNGEATALLVLGPAPGATNNVKVSALSNGSHLTGSPTTFTATAALLSSLQLVDGNNQVGTVGAELTSALKVKVVDTRGKGIKGWPVQFTIKSSGGKLNGKDSVLTVNTDSLGLASVRLTLGPVPGTNNNVVEASTTYNGQPLSGSPIVFQATAKVGTPVAIVIAGGNKQRGVVGLPLPQPLQARVVDALNNGIPNHEVTFEVKAGGGNLNGATLRKVLTNSNGIAQVTLTVGIVAGEDNNIVEARAFSGTTPLGNSPLLFTASATSSSARFIEYVSGNQQQGTAGMQLAKALVVRVTDGTPSRNPVPNHPVVFTVKTGGGTLNTGNDSEVVVSTNAQGQASVNWILGGLVAPDSQIVEAASTDGHLPLTGAPVRFAAIAQPGPTSPTVSSVEATGPVPADGQSKSSVTVYLRDQFGNPIAGHAVSVRVSGDGNSIDQPLTLTDGNGKVQASFSSIRSGLKRVTAFDINAQTEVTNGDTVRFTPLAAQSLLMDGGNGQTRNVGTALASPLIAKVTDRNGNPVSRWPVQFTVLSGGGYFLETQPLMTDANGQAKVTYVLGENPGQNSIEARALNLSAAPITFTATGKIGTASQLQALPGSNGQTGVAGEPLPSPIGVLVTDSNGDPIAGHRITFTITFGNGTVNGASQATVSTDPFGIARATWRLGEVSGPNVLEATSETLSNAKEIFTAQGVEGEAAKLEIAGSQTITGGVSGQASRALTVRVVDVHGNPVRNFIVRFQLVVGTGSLSATEATTNSDGYASVSFTFGPETGQRVVRASGDGLANSPVNFYLIASAGSPKSIAVYDGNNQKGTVGQPLSRAVRVIVKDQFGNPVPGVNVNFIPTQNNGSFVGGPTKTTDKRGLAWATWTLGTNPGSNKAWAIAQGIPQIEISATGVTNNLPVFQQISVQSAKETEKVEFTVSASDADGDAISYGVRNIPPGAAFDSLVTQVFIWNTGYDNAGLHEVIFTARDSKGDVAEYLVTIEIENVNRPPRITNWQPAAGNIPVKTGQTQRFEVTAIDPDGDELSSLWFLDGRHVGSSHQYFYQPSTTGNRTLVAKIFDHIDTTSHSWILDVTTSVQLASFTAAFTAGDGVVLNWVTARESNNAGFNIWRSATENGSYRQLNSTLIPATDAGVYRFTDTDVVVGRTYYYKLEDVSYGGSRQLHGPIAVLVAPPKTFDLAQNYPNPFNPTTTIRYQLPEAADVKLVIYNILGQAVRTLVDEHKVAGYYAVNWDGRNNRGVPVTTGVYYYKITAGSFSASKKMLLMK